MPTSRRLYAWLCVLLVLLQAVAPALHALQHHRAPFGRGHVDRSCACGQLHAVGGRDGRGDIAGPARATDPEHCAVCEILRSLRVFDGPAALPAERGAPVRIAASLPAPVAPLAAPRPQPFLARAPPQFLV